MDVVEATRVHPETAINERKEMRVSVYPNNFLLPFDSTEVLGVESEGWGTAQHRHRACKIRSTDLPYSVGERKGTGCCSANGVRESIYSR